MHPEKKRRVAKRFGTSTVQGVNVPLATCGQPGAVPIERHQAFCVAHLIPEPQVSLVRNFPRHRLLFERNWTKARPLRKPQTVPEPEFQQNQQLRPRLKRQFHVPRSIVQSKLLPCVPPGFHDNRHSAFFACQADSVLRLSQSIENWNWECVQHASPRCFRLKTSYLYIQPTPKSLTQ